MMAIEGWTSVDGFYWATVTIMTVGANLTFFNSHCKILLYYYIVGGIW